MKITIYELLGMVKDSKAPKKIKYDNIIFEYDGVYYVAEHTYLDEYCDLSRVLNDTVEIIEEEKKIPEKLDYCEENTFMEQKETTYLSQKERILLDSNFKELGNKINEIIDCLDYLKSKGE